MPQKRSEYGSLQISSWQIRYFTLQILYRKYLIISTRSFTIYSSESEFIQKGYKSFRSTSALISALLMLLVFTITSRTRKTWPQKILRCKDEKKVTTEALLELAELVLENKFFQVNENTLKQLKGTVIGTTFVPPYGIISIMVDLEERILEDIELQSRICWRYINDIFFIWEHEEDSLK